MKITKAATAELYHLENDGAFTPFTNVSISELGTLFFMVRDCVTLFFNGPKRDKALKLINESGIDVLYEKDKING
jgi:hypothetical protein